jgi:DNA excision repair protein ERCC-2
LFKETLYPLVKDEIRVNSEEKKTGFTHTTKLPSRLIDILNKLLEDVENEIPQILKSKDMQREMRLITIREYRRKINRFIGALMRFDTGYELFVNYEDGKISAKVMCIDPYAMVNDRLGKGHGAVFFSATLTPLSYYKSVLGNDRGAITLEGVSPFAKEQLNVSIMDKVSTRFLQRDNTLLTVTKIIAASISPKRGNYIIFTPSFAYANALYEVFKSKYPKIKSILQTSHMSNEDRAKFLNEFEKQDDIYLVAFCVIGGIFAEGIDLTGERLIGVVVVGVGLPTPTVEREAIANYFDEKSDNGKQYAYIYPGINRVLQAAGRVIRTEDDRGIIVLIDDRLNDPIYKKALPDLWRDVNYPSDAKQLNEIIQNFWKDI